MPNQEFFSDRDLAKIYNVSRSAPWRWVREGLLDPPIKLSGKCSRWSQQMREKFELGRAPPKTIRQREGAISWSTHNKQRPGANPGADRIGTPAQYSASPADALLALLDAVRQTGPCRWIARCTAHSDRNPSLSVRECGDGTLLLKCWTGCSAADVMMACGLTLADLFPSRIHGRSPLRRGERWVPADVLKCVAREAVVVLCAAGAVRRGEALSDEDTERLAMAAGRLREASHG